MEIETETKVNIHMTGTEAMLMAKAIRRITVCVPTDDDTLRLVQLASMLETEG